MVQNAILDKDLKRWSDFGKTANTLMIIVAEWSQGFIGPLWVLSNDFESPDRSLHLHSTKKEDIWVELWASATEPITSVEMNSKLCTGVNHEFMIFSAKET